MAGNSKSYRGGIEETSIITPGDSATIQMSTDKEEDDMGEETDSTLESSTAGSNLDSVTTSSNADREGENNNNSD